MPTARVAEGGSTIEKPIIFRRRPGGAALRYVDFQPPSGRPRQQ